jgi:DNA-binding transcriptional MerR regulator
MPSLLLTGPGSAAAAAATAAKDAAPEPALLKVGDLARRTGKSVRALRLYEELGLLTPSQRSIGGFRLYGADQLARVDWIGKLQAMGFALGEIQDLLRTVESAARAPEAMHDVRARFRARLEETRAQVAALLQLERDLSESLAYLEGCRSCSESAAPAVCAHCDETHAHRHDTPAPALVSGIHRGLRRDDAEAR